MNESGEQYVKRNKPATKGQILLTCGTQSSLIHRDRKDNGGCQGLEEGKMELFFNGSRLLVLREEKYSGGGW